MKVALLSHEGGGISSVCFGLAYSLSKRKIPTTVFAATSMKYEVERLNDFLKVIHLPFFDIPPRAVWFNLRNFRRLFNLLKGFSVIHGVSPDISMTYASFRNKIGNPLVVTIHGTPRGSLEAFISSRISSWTFGEIALNILELPLHELGLRKCLGSSDHIVACSSSTLKELKNYENFKCDNVSVIYNGVDFEEIEKVKINQENARDHGDGDSSIVYAGRLFWMKGVMYALEAFEIAKRDFKNISLNIFGKGPLEGEVKKRIVDSGLKDSVFFRGQVPHKELIADVKRSDLVVLPSLYEAQPMFVLEAMACQKPVVVFDAPYSREIITNMENGLLAKPCDVKDLYDKIALLLSDRDLQKKLGQNGYDYAKREHNWDKQSEKYIEIYRKVMSEKKNG